MKHTFFLETRVKLAYCTLLVSLLLSYSSCTDTETKIITNSLAASSETIVFGSGSASQELKLETSIGENELTVTVPSNSNWCTANIKNGFLTISVANNESETIRKTVISIIAKNQKQDILVTQDRMFSKDILLKVAKVTTTSQAEGLEADKMIDGNVDTYFNSQFGAITEWPFNLDFYFEDIDQLDYITHIPRQDAGNKWGAIGKFELWIATESNNVLTKYGDYDFGMVLKSASKIEFEKPIEKPTQVQFRILAGLENRVSCAEMQFYRNNTYDFSHFLQFFTDASCSEIKPGLTEADLNKIPDLFYRNIALSIFNDTYDKEFRIQEYRPYQHPLVMATINKTEKYDLKDNATGIYIEKPGEDFVVFVGDTKKQDIKLVIKDYQADKEETLPLKEGLNILKPSLPGLLYIYNHTDDNIPLFLETDAEKKAAAAKTVKINIVSGAINGYFDIQKHTASDWDRLLTNYAKHTEIDILGRHSHVTWITAEYRKNNTNIVKMTENIDKIVDSQKEFMGLYYYKKEMTNRMFLFIKYSVAAAAAGAYGTYYNASYSNVFCTEGGFNTRLWVLGHEVGHINQVRPGVKWAGTTEVTNNLYAMYNQQIILGEAERLNTGSDSYNVAFKEIIENKQPWVLPDNYGKHITKLPPFWQLKLYFVDILKQEHFYHDLFEHYRVTENLNQAVLGDNYHGMLQLDFVRQVCNTAKMDMIEFFEDWGFLRPINRVVDDYGDKTLKITQEQIDALKKEITSKNYQKPAIRVQDLTDLNYKEYINK